MVGIVLIGRSFGNLCHYAWDEDKDAKVLAAHGVRDWSVGEMAADFDVQQRLRPRLNTAVLHVALAWPAQEQARLTDELMCELALAYLAKMKIDAANTQWAVVRHYDQDHPHCHLIINRITNDGKVLNDSKSFQRSEEACRDLEKEYGLLSAAQIGIANKLKEAQEGKLSTYDTARAYIHEAVARQLPAVTTVTELTTVLATEGITMHSTFANDKLQKVVFEREGVYVKGSAISRELSGAKLGETLEIQHKQEAEKRALEAQAARQREEKSPAPPSFRELLSAATTSVLQAQKLSAPPAQVPPALRSEVQPELPAKPTVPEQDPLKGPALAPSPGPAPEVRTTAISTTTHRQVEQPPGPPPLAGAGSPAVAPPTESQRRAAIFRDAAAGEWDALDQAKGLIQQLLTKALGTTETESMRIVKEIEKQGFKFNPNYTQIRHQESKLIVKLTEVQPGGPKAHSFAEQVNALAQANQAAEREKARQATVVLAEAFLKAKPFFIDREEGVGQFAKVGLAASWPVQVAGEGGKLTLTHLASGHIFSHEELPVNGQPLLPQVNALGTANWESPERRAHIHYRDEAQGAKMKAAFQQAGVHLLPAETGNERVFGVSYRLDSREIEQIDLIFQKITASDGARVVESGAATKQREAKSLERFMDGQQFGRMEQWER